jgi:hypothetical protein
MTLVVEAIARGELAFRSNSTCPVDSSARITALARTLGAATATCPACSAAETACPVPPVAPMPVPARAAETPGIGRTTAAATDSPCALAAVEAATDPPCVLRITARTTTITKATGGRVLAGRVPVRREVLWGFIDMLLGR